MTRFPFKKKNLYPSTHRTLTNAVHISKEVRVLERGGAPSQLLRQVPVKSFGDTGGVEPTRTLSVLGQLQVLLLLAHQAREASVVRTHTPGSDFIRWQMPPKAKHNTYRRKIEKHSDLR